MYKIDKVIYFTVIALVCIFSISPTSIAETSPPGDSMFYYRLGGGRVFKAVPRWEVTQINVGVRASITGLSCGKFDPKVTISNTLNRVKNGADKIYSQLESAASGVISNLPGYILSKINPNLYDLFMNSIAQAQTSFSMATKSCEKISAELRDGGDPFEEFITVSVGDTWKGSAGTSGVDIMDVQEKAENARNNGISHPCHGRAGGLNQPKFKVLGDVSEVGYNRLLNRSACLSSGISVTSTSPPIVKKFDTPAKAREWVNVVVGEVTVDTSIGGAPSSTPGSGLLPVINTRKVEVLEQLTRMYQGSVNLTLANLAEISAPGVLITAQIIEGIRTLSPQESQIFLERIADEIAVADTIDSALLVRRMLATGAKETEFFATRAVSKYADKAISQIDNEINLVMKEVEIRKKLLGESLPLLLNMVKAKETNSLYEIPVNPQSTKQLEDGRVKTSVLNN